MKQIKTIVEPLGRATRFDKSINSLLSEGWELKKRAVIEAPSEPSESFNVSLVRLLYAELEKDKHYFEEITL